MFKLGRGCLRVHELTRLCFALTRAAQRLMLRANRPSMCGSRTRTPSRRAVLQQEASSTGEWALAGSRRLRRRSFSLAEAVGTSLIRLTDNVVGVAFKSSFRGPLTSVADASGCGPGNVRFLCGVPRFASACCVRESADFGHIQCELCLLPFL